jgi:hypothetical protein
MEHVDAWQGPCTASEASIGSYQEAAEDNDGMVDDTARDRAIYHALKAADEVAAALQAYLIEEHRADPDRTTAQNPATNSLKLLRQARERLGQGLRAGRGRKHRRVRQDLPAKPVTATLSIPISHEARHAA